MIYKENKEFYLRKKKRTNEQKFNKQMEKKSFKMKEKKSP